MKRFSYIFFALLLAPPIAYCQYAFRSAGGNSGILAGTNNASQFAGINYDLSSSNLGLSLRQSTQNKSNHQLKERSINYLDLIGHNAYLGFGIKDSKSTLLKNKAWQGILEAAYDFSYTWDRTPVDSRSASFDTVRSYYSRKDSSDTRKQFSSLKACESEFGSPCEMIITKAGYYDLGSYENRASLLQHTGFFRLSGSMGENQLAVERPDLKQDSLMLKSEFFVTPRITVGYNLRKRITPKLTFIGAFSIAYYFQTRSTAKLMEFTFQQIDTIPTYNGGSTTKINTSKNYYLGTTYYEGILNPRLDLIANINLGEKRPYLNIIGALAPTFSSFASVGFKNNYAIGLGLSLPVVPDQMLFAILFEGLSVNKKDKKVNMINLYATVPFSFK